MQDLRHAQKWIERYAASLTIDHDERDDLAQVCLIKAWRSLSAFRGQARLSTWLYRIVRNEYLSGVRLARRRRALVEQQVQPPVEHHGVADRVLAKVDADRLLSSYSGLDRTILELRCIEERTSIEIASVLNMAPSSVRCRLHRLRRESRGPS